jgi:hypothetical protein
VANWAADGNICKGTGIPLHESASRKVFTLAGGEKCDPGALQKRSGDREDRKNEMGMEENSTRKNTKKKGEVCEGGIV